MKRVVSIPVLLAGVWGCAQPTPEQRIIDDAAAALGGRDRVAAVTVLTMDGEGTQYNLGQDVRPDERSQTFSLTGYRRVIDAAAGRARTEQVRTPNFAYFQGQAPQKQVFGIDGELAYNVAANGNATRASDAVARDRRAELYHHPVTSVRAALAEGATVANARTAGAERLVDVTTAGGILFTLAIDGTSSLPVRVESKSAHPNLGDVNLATTFADYQEADGLQLPRTMAARVDDFTTVELRIGAHRLDQDGGDLAAPAAVASAAPAAPPAPTVTAEPVGKGIWLLAGQSHHSALVEFSDHLMLIEAPQNEARTLAVIAKARETVPGKPLTKLVTSHHHFDHTAGVRAAIAEGLTIVTHSGNRAFFEQIARRAHTVVPDALARAPKEATIETVEDELVLEDAAMSLTLFHLSGNPHSETMLVAYLPRERVLVEVDVFSPGAQVNPYAANLLEHVTKRRLRVDRIVPLHGAIVPFTELTKALAPTTD